jgi:hypothetical protein
MTVVATARPPTIDGEMWLGEWGHAAATTGQLNLADGNLAREQTVVYVTYDADRLCLAFDATLAREQSPSAWESRQSRKTAGSCGAGSGCRQ